jgi:hypothetical protein
MCALTLAAKAALGKITQKKVIIAQMEIPIVVVNFLVILL